MRNYNVESKSVHGKKQFASNFFFLLLSVRQYKKFKSCVIKRRAHRARVDKLHGHS